MVFTLSLNDVMEEGFFFSNLSCLLQLVFDITFKKKLPITDHDKDLE